MGFLVCQVMIHAVQVLAVPARNRHLVGMHVACHTTLHTVCPCKSVTG